MGSTQPVPITPADLTIVPANQATWADLSAIFDSSDSRHCHCQAFKTRGQSWRQATDSQRQARLREQTGCDDPAAASTSGLVAYLTEGRVPVGWVAVEPRTAYPRLLGKPTVWRGRHEDRDDAGVWSVTCFAVRKGYRRRGVSYALAVAAAGYARDRGARALEGYAMRTQPGQEITWGELYVGAVQVFADAGFTEVSAPSVRRAVMRLDFAADAADSGGCR
jgi:GNAT superfamily N-acetyltransferase